MSSLDKLAIRGIRSFDSNEISVMQFYSPLTVIVGHNGSGKTTIIECLKYATTGDLPPGAKGGAFIHDPTIAGVNEVKAQVKLRFNNSRKEKMLVERRLQVTKKKTVSGLSMKTLEGTISYADPDGVDKRKRQSLSTKCANIDEEVPAQLGVSKAILQNVIFCHQEESNWPLSEPAALKKKFDDIFEASDYTKVLDEIKKIRKDQNVDIKVDREKLSALKTDRDRAFKLRENLKKVSSQIAVKQATYDELEERIAKLVSDNKTFFNQATKYQDIIGKVDTLRERRNLHEENLGNLMNGTKELPDSEQELKAKIENHTANLDSLRSEREGTKQRLGDEQDSLAVHERKRSQAQTTHGRLLALKQRYQDMLEQRKALVRDLAEKHGIAGYAHELSDAEIKAFEEKLDEAVVAQQKKIEKIKSDARAAENKYQDEIQALKSAKAADERAKATIAEQIRSANSRIASISRQLEATTTSVADITYLESTLKEEKERQAAHEDKQKTANYAEQLRARAREAKDLEEKRDALHTELAGLNAQANTRAKLQLRRTEKTRKDEVVASLIDRSAASYRKFLKAEPTKDKMEAEVTELINELERDVGFAERSARDASRELQNVETSVSFAKKKVRDLTAQAESAKNKVADGLKGLDTQAATVEEALQEAEEEVAAVHTDLAGADSIQKFYDTVLIKAQKNHTCIGCDRSISRDELPDLERYVKRRKEKGPQELRRLKEELRSWEKQLADLKALVPAELTYNRLTKDEIPAAEAAAAQQDEKLAPAREKAEETTAQLNEVKDRLRDVQALKKTAADVSRLHRESEDVARDIGKLENELSVTGSTATTDEIQEQLRQLGEQLRTIKAATDQIRSDQQKTASVLQTLSATIHGHELDLSKRRQELKDKEALEQTQVEAREQIGKLEKQSKELDKKLADAVAPIRQKENELSTIRNDFTRDEAAASRQLQTYNKSMEQLDSNSREIKSYENRGGDTELVKCERDLKQHDTVITDAKQRIAQLQAQISQIDQTLADSKAVLRNFQDNLRLRTERRSLEALDQQIEELDEDAARKAYRKFESDYNEQRRKQAELQAEQARLGGEIQTLANDEKDKKEELETEYRGIDDRDPLTQTAEMSNQDLEKLSKALDGAIMRFHGLKMKEINDTIADLWTKTYQGTDIDKIMIKSDAEGKTTGTARSYNYRVVMFKDTTEMDMRGRCSAGQKVLASIIIRLALAESFSINCGIMALDEPTTNLDHDNVQALAASLSEIIKERKHQANFQLIVITHDEGFLETLGGSGVLDKYWRVSRGDGGQVSTIERQRLT
ncbi:AAA domain-containing protein [Rhodotorula diobovata]|uniref:DNA repair protein RAD50 n=1 Tax=Rhodotorula diobovata TaxID=5288 RepID=A0A5C5FZG1_9BASI|nr:AAA domain-containing protein [Rhodotorula diobovata]